MNIIQRLILGFSLAIAHFSMVLQASIDTKHTAEQSFVPPTVSTATATTSVSTTLRVAPPALLAMQQQHEELYKKHATLLKLFMPCTGSASEKIATFIQAAHQKNSKTLYDMAHDPDIALYLQDAKNYEEVAIGKVTDDQSKTIFEHAIENNDAQFARKYAQKVSDEQRKKMIRHAAAHKKPRVVLALIPKETDQPMEDALRKHLFSIQDLTLTEYTTWQEALIIAQQKEKRRALGITQTVVATTSLLPELAKVIAQQLHPTLEFQSYPDADILVPTMHPELRQAIVDGNLGKYDKLVVDGGWLTGAHSRNAFSLAVVHGQLDIVRQLTHRTPFIGEKQKKELKKIAEDKAEYFKKCVGYDADALKKHTAYSDIAQCIETAWPDQKKDTALLKVLAEGNTGAFAQALAQGANPHTISNDTQSIALKVLYVQPVFLKMLIDTQQLNLETPIKLTDGKMCSLLGTAISLNKPDHVKLLLDAGANPNGINEHGDPITGNALHQDPLFLKMLIDTKRLNLEAPIKDTRTGKALAPLFYAIDLDKRDHVKLLLDAGANPNTINELGNPIASNALFKDPLFLKMLIDTKRLNLETPVKVSNGKKMCSLLRIAIGHNKPEHVKLLLAAGASPNAINEDGNPIADNTLYQDPMFLKMLIDTKRLNLEVGIKITNEKMCSLLGMAIYLNKPEHAKLLLAAGANLSALDHTGIPIILNPANKALFSTLIQDKEMNYVLLLRLIDENEPEQVKFLFSIGADPNAIDSEGNPVIKAALTCQGDGCFRAIAMHPKFNPNVCIKDFVYGTELPLVYWTIDYLKPDYTQLLLQRGANPNALGERGNPIVCVTLDKDPIFLKIFLDSKKLTTNILNKLLVWAHCKNKKNHAKLLQDALAQRAEEEYIYSCA